MTALSRAPRLAQHLAYFAGGYLGRAAKHQVLEQVGEARLAGFHFIARAGLHRNLDAHQVRNPVGTTMTFSPFGSSLVASNDRTSSAAAAAADQRPRPPAASEEGRSAAECEREQAHGRAPSVRKIE